MQSHTKIENYIPFLFGFFLALYLIYLMCALQLFRWPSTCCTTGTTSTSCPSSATTPPSSSHHVPRALQEQQVTLEQDDPQADLQRAEAVHRDEPETLWRVHTK